MMRLAILTAFLAVGAFAQGPIGGGGGIPAGVVPTLTSSSTLIGQTTTQTLLTLTIPASGQYLLQVVQFPTVLSGTLATTLSWTSYTGLTNTGFQLTSQTASAFPSSDAFPLVALAGTTLTVTVTVTGTATYNASAVLVREF
jgi:hypothetical protein